MFTLIIVKGKDLGWIYSWRGPHPIKKARPNRPDPSWSSSETFGELYQDYLMA
jgi:hypothetical protein